MKRLGTRSLAIDSIEVVARLRQVDPDDVKALAASIRETGLQQPVQVLQVQGKSELRPDDSNAGPYRLIAGAHRLAAVTALGQTEIEAVIFWGSEREARLQEIDENLFRRELSPFDRAKFLVERKSLYEALNPQAKAGGDRKSPEFKQKNQTANFAICSFADDVAERLGFSGRTVRDAIWLWSHLDERVREMLELHPVAHNASELKLIAKQEPMVQRVIASHLVGGTAKRAAEALERVRPTPAKAMVEEETASKLIDAWRRTSKKGRVTFLRNLVGMDVIDDFRGDNV